MNKEIYRMAAVLVAGMLLGGVFLTIIIGRQIDKLQYTNDLLSRQLELCQDDLNHLKQSMGARDKEIVTGIETNIAVTGENMTALEENNVLPVLDQQVREWLEPVKGQEVKKLNHLLVPQIIDNRTVEYEGAVYRLKVKLVVIDANIVIYLEAKKEKTPVL
jgi:hypothetical protein